MIWFSLFWCLPPSGFNSAVHCPCKRENERGSGGEQKEYIAIIPVLLKGVVECPRDILVNLCKELVQTLGLVWINR
jgi:hypothetical protein